MNMTHMIVEIGDISVYVEPVQGLLLYGLYESEAAAQAEARRAVESSPRRKLVILPLAGTD